MKSVFVYSLKDKLRDKQVIVYGWGIISRLIIFCTQIRGNIISLAF